MLRCVILPENSLLGHKAPDEGGIKCSEGIYAWVRAGPALEYSIPEVEGCPPAQPYSAVHQWLQQDIHEAVKADKGMFKEAL